MTPTTLPNALTVRVRTRSDWHIGSGAGAPGRVDAAIRRDAADVPYVPGTTLTGVYREACLQVALGLDGGAPGAWTTWRTRLFGSRQHDSVEPSPAVVRIRSARASAALLARLRRSADLRGATTFTKPGVAVDPELGRAVDGGLRFVEMARSGLVLTAPMELDTEGWSPEQHTAATVLLVLGAAWLRSLGGDRRRGAGEVDVELIGAGCAEWTDWVTACADWAAANEAPEPPAPAATGDALVFAQRAAEDTGWLAVPLTLTTVDPVRAPRVTLGNVVRGHSHLPGTTMLAWLLRTLSAPAALRQALTSGAAVITAATPDVAGLPGRPHPAALQTDKHATDGVLHNRLLDPDVVGGAKATKWVAHDGADPVLTVKADADTEFVTHNVITEHTGRPTSDDGGVFTVEVIPAGRTLRCALRLTVEVERALVAELGPDWLRPLVGSARLGAAGKSEYGRVTVAVGDLTPIAQVAPAAAELAVWALSDVLVRDRRLRLSGRVDDVITELARRLDVRLTLLGVVGQAARTDSWQASWRLPRPSLVGLAAGTCLRLRMDGTPTPQAFAAVVAGGLGERRGEGFGQLALDPDLLKARTVPTSQPTRVLDPLPTSGDVEQNLTPEDRAYLAVVERAAMRAILALRVGEVDADTRARLAGALRAVSRTQRAAVRDAVAALGAPGGAAALDVFLRRKEKRAAVAGLIKGLDALRRDTETNPLRPFVNAVTVSLGLSAPPDGTHLEAFGLLVLDTLADIDAGRTGAERSDDPLATRSRATPLPQRVPDRRHRRNRGTQRTTTTPADWRQSYRQVHTRWELTAAFITRTPLHVGGTHGDPYVDLTVARDGQGRPYVPGTSWAGVLRGWWLRGYGAPRTASVWDGTARGTAPSEAKNAELLASLVTVADSTLSSQDGSPVITTIRDGVGIDRRRGAAAHRVKYEREVVPAGTLLRLRLTAEDVETAHDLGDMPPLAKMLAALADALRDQELVLGAAGSRGLGTLAALPDTVVLTSHDMRSRAGVLDAIRGTLAAPAPYPDKPVVRAIGPAAGVLRLALTWQPDGPLLVRGNQEGVRAQIVPLMSAHPETGEPVPVLPGASLKGVLRSEVERSLRTLLDVPAAGDFTASMLGLTRRCPPFEALFGSPDRRGALSVPDVYADPLRGTLTWPRWQRYLGGDLPGPPVPGWQEMTHVAIDRWSGGPADGMLYTVLEPHGLTWAELRLDIDMHRLPEEFQTAAVTLLLYAVAAMAAGSVPLGHGVNRGMGAVRLTGLRVSGHPVPGLTFEDHTLDGSPAERRATVLALARGLWGDSVDTWTDHLFTAAAGGTE